MKIFELTIKVKQSGKDVEEYSLNNPYEMPSDVSLSVAKEVIYLIQYTNNHLKIQELSEVIEDAKAARSELENELNKLKHD